MDGTLVDSELYSERAVRELLAKYELSGEGIDYSTFYGITWASIAHLLQQRFTELQGNDIAGPLQELFHSIGLASPPPPIPGSAAAVTAAFEVAKTAIATSSNRASLEVVMDDLGIRHLLTTTVASEDYGCSKPDPECYLTVAARLGSSPERCLVFEDSIPGIRAAKAAGMSVIAVTYRSTDIQLATELADATVVDFSEIGNLFEHVTTRAG
ncbi:hypothetical protein CYMTET_17760 [Cymbomonas tetramitiformis]|uniref:HAD family phosphatase n=1 Tax=Cymbomonas tetramitiformis TaxID=36881 RepID=A0AAE0L6L7_9CHLO|nr:hypothetical protein CYMTET_17760 [Cymbomonas tetramitiformis]